MPLDYSWSFDAIFPADVFADPKVGPLLAMADIAFEYRGNHVPALHSADTAIALVASPRPILDFMIDKGVALTPHSATRPGDEVGIRSQFAIKELSEIADKYAAGNLSEEKVKSSVFLLHFFIRNHIRSVERNPETGRFEPIPKLVAAASGTSGPAFDADACSKALAAAPSALPEHRRPLATHLSGGITLTATVLLDDAGECGAVKDRILADPTILGGFRIGDLSPGSFTAQRDDMMFVAMAIDAPYPANGLKALCSGNLLEMNIWEAVAQTRAHVHLQLMCKAADLATRDDAMTLARIAAAIGGRAVIWGPATAVTASETFSAAVTAAHKDGGWPTRVILRMGSHKVDNRAGVALIGLSPFTGYDIAQGGANDDKLSQVAGRALRLAGWVLDARPQFADGDTMGVEGSGGAQLRVREIKMSDGVAGFEFRPYDGPPAPYTPADRAARMASKGSEGSSAPRPESPTTPARPRPFWKFWGK